MSGTLEKLVQAHGVLATVSHTLVNFPLGGQRMQFRVVGADITVKSIEFSDDLATNDRAIQQSVSQLIGTRIRVAPSSFSIRASAPGIFDARIFARAV